MSPGGDNRGKKDVHTIKAFIFDTYLLGLSLPQSAQFYKVTNENYHKAAEEVNAKFK